MLPCVACYPPAAGQVTVGVFVLTGTAATSCLVLAQYPGCTDYRLCVWVAHLFLSPSLNLASCMLLCLMSVPSSCSGTAFAFIADIKNLDASFRAKRYHTVIPNRFPQVVFETRAGSVTHFLQCRSDFPATAHLLPGGCWHLAFWSTLGPCWQGHRCRNHASHAFVCADVDLPGLCGTYGPRRNLFAVILCCDSWLEAEACAACSVVELRPVLLLSGWCMCSDVSE